MLASYNKDIAKVYTYEFNEQRTQYYRDNIELFLLSLLQFHTEWHY